MRMLLLVSLQITIVLWLYQQALSRNTVRLRNHVVCVAADDQPGGHLPLAPPPAAEMPVDPVWVCADCRRRTINAVAPTH